MIAVTHPGKMGDALYALPAIRALCARHRCKADFWTSSACAPIVPFMAAQKDVRQALVSMTYVPGAFDCGGQPPLVPLDGREHEYEAVYHLGYRRVPDRPLHEFMALEAGLGLHEVPHVHYEVPPARSSIVNVLPRPYVVFAPRGETTFKDSFLSAMLSCPFHVVQAGGQGDLLFCPGTTDMTGIGFVEMAQLIAGSSGFVGLMSAPLVVAQGFPVPKIVPHDGRSWDMRHAPVNPWTHYRAGSTGTEWADHLRSLPVLSRTLADLDYRHLCHDAPLVDEARAAIHGTPYFFQHHHRQWEYSLCVQAARLAFQGRGAWPHPFDAPLAGRRVLDVGGALSPLGPAMARMGAEVHVVDPAAEQHVLDMHAARVGAVGRLKAHKRHFGWSDRKDPLKYDAVFCVSVLEHVPEGQDGDDECMARALASMLAPGGVLLLTVDSHPTGQARCQGHLRTYGIEGLTRLQHAIEKAPGVFCDDDPAWAHRGDNVNGLYTFASIHARRDR